MLRRLFTSMRASRTDPQSARERAAKSGPFKRFAAKGIHPGIASWNVEATFDDDQLPCAGGRIELWTGAAGGDPFVYPLLAAAFAQGGEIVAIVAAETQPGVHPNVYLGMFLNGQHSNHGKGPWTEPDVFMNAALPLLSSLLVEAADSEGQRSAQPG